MDGGDQGLLTIADNGLDPKPANRRHHRGSSTFGDTVGKTTKSNFFLNKNKNSFLEWKSGVNNKLLSGLEHKVFPEFICFLKNTPVHNVLFVQYDSPVSKILGVFFLESGLSPFIKVVR